MVHEKFEHFRDRGTLNGSRRGGGNERMLAFAAVIFSPAPGTLSGRTIRSPAASRPTLARCGKKPVPETPQSILSSRRPARSSRRPWAPRCLRALAAAAAAALALALCPPDIIPAHASSVGERLKPSTPYPCEDVRSYYGGLEGLSGDVLMAKLGAVVSPHASLRYKDVGVGGAQDSRCS